LLGGAQALLQVRPRLREVWGLVVRYRQRRLRNRVWQPCHWVLPGRLTMFFGLIDHVVLQPGEFADQLKIAFSIA
jgi:hypothetical protein